LGHDDAQRADSGEGDRRRTHRPIVVAFDVVETLFSLAPVEEALEPLGVGLDLFFTRLLRDAFALAASGDFRPFGEVARSALEALAADAHGSDHDHVIEAFGELPAHPDVAPALDRLVEAGIEAVALTNGGADNTRRLIANARLDDRLARVISVAEVGIWKPAAAPYLHAAVTLGQRPPDVAMVAVHAWDVHGARRAGLVTGWCARLEGRYPAIFDEPDVAGPDLVTVVGALLALPHDERSGA
jgi:2-haloacid dehalogenase